MTPGPGERADLIAGTFGPAGLRYPPGHQEIEIGLVKLYRLTSRPRYPDLARFFVNLHGRADTHTLRGPYQQDDKPIVDQSVAVGHAVRAGYFYSGVADVAANTGDQALVAAINRIWEDVTYRKLHLTGGIGARPGGEAFGEPYELPNRSAYLETCAAIANALWNHRMLLLHGDARYLDVLERVIYNGFLAGVSLGGDRFGRSAHAVDSSEGMLARDKEKLQAGNVRFSFLDIRGPWEFESGSFDLIVCNLVLEHIQDLGSIFSEPARTLRPRGSFFINELHPFRQYGGTKARFSRGDKKIEVKAYIHHISDFLRAGEKHSLALVRLDEYWHEDDQNKPPRLLSLSFERR